jgi:hypothetical protein
LLKAKLCIEINSQNKTTQTYEVYVINYSSALILLRGLEELSVWRGVTYSN